MRFVPDQGVGDLKIRLILEIFSVDNFCGQKSRKLPGSAACIMYPHMKRNTSQWTSMEAKVSGNKSLK